MGALRYIVGAIAAAAFGSSAFAQTAADPAEYPHDMSSFGCTHRDGDYCDQAPAEPPDFYPLVGQWVRFAILRNGFNVQPPESPLYVMFTPDGYWSMMEFPADRPKIAKPLDQQTSAELTSRYARMAGGWGNFTNIGQFNYRHHKNGLGRGDGQNTQLRAWRFEGNILVLEGTGPTGSPTIRTRKLPKQPLAMKGLAGAWERTSYTVNGAPGTATPERFLFNDDGWYQATTLPTGRRGVQGTPMAQWTPAQFVTAYGGMEASRGTYAYDGKTLARRHVGDVDPNLEGKISRGAIRVRGDTFTWEGTDAAGRKFRSEYKKLAPFDIYAPLPSNPTGGG